MDAHKLAFDAASFDFVFSSENMEHLRDPDQNVAEIKRVLRPGGIFMVATPNKEVSSPEDDRPPNEFHEIEFTFDGMQQLLSPFETVHIFESSLESEFASGRAMKKARRERGAIGIEAKGKSVRLSDRLDVELQHLHNTHSFLALAW
jgi:SAM-dependent methyltransferase